VYYHFASMSPLIGPHSDQYSSLQSVGALIRSCLYDQFRQLEQNITDFGYYML